jgi:hypothetical protein
MQRTQLPPFGLELKAERFVIAVNPAVSGDLLRPLKNLHSTYVNDRSYL